MTTSTRTQAFGVILASVAVVAGCGSDGASSADSTSASAATSASAGAGASAGTSATGSWTTYCDEANRAKNPCGMVDESGREWLFRGINARVQGVFDVTFTDGRAPLEPIPEFTAEDVAEMKKIGFNLLRLPVQWSAIEPEPGQYDQAYLDKIAAVAQLCADGGIGVLVDFHQDAYSKEIGEDGAPAWAVLPSPTEPNAGGELGPLIVKRLADQTQLAFASFWKNEQVAGKGLQDHYIGALTHVADAVNDNPAVVGIEVFNEPWLLHAQTLLASKGQDPGLDISMLYDFYGKAIPALQKSLPNKLIIFDPDVAKNDPAQLPPGSSDQADYSATVPSPVPWPAERTVYGPHLYVKGFFNPGDAAAGYPAVNPADPNIALSLNNSMAEAKAFGAPLLIGEFGFTPKAAQYAQTLDAIYAETNANGISTAQWVWKEESQDSWGFYDYSSGQPVLREDAAQASAQAYPQAVSGKLTTAAFDSATQTLTVDFVYQDTGQPSLLFAPLTFAYADGYVVRCGDDEVQPVVVDPAGWLSVECGEDDGTAYTITLAPKA